MRNRVVPPGSTRHDLSDGDWIELKNELNVGDSKRLENAGMKPPVVSNGRVMSQVDIGVWEIERVLVYVTKWSLRGPHPDPELAAKGELADDPLPLNSDAVKALDTETFGEIGATIMKHAAETLAKKVKAAMAKAGATPPTIPSTNTAQPAGTSAPSSTESTEGQTLQ